MNINEITNKVYENLGESLVEKLYETKENLQEEIEKAMKGCQYDFDTLVPFYLESIEATLYVLCWEMDVNMVYSILNNAYDKWVDPYEYPGFTEEERDGVECDSCGSHCMSELSKMGIQMFELEIETQLAYDKWHDDDDDYDDEEYDDDYDDDDYDE